MDDLPLGELRDFMADLPVFWEVRCNHCHYSQECVLEEEANIRAMTHEGATDHDCDLLTVALCGDPPEALGFVEVYKDG